MKHILAAIMYVVCISGATAATVVPAPEIEETISAEGFGELTCKVRTGEIAWRLYFGVITVDGVATKKHIGTKFLNGEKIWQRDEIGSGPSQRIVRYVRNSQGRNWLRYEQDAGYEETKEMQKRVLAELGLSEAEYDSCFTKGRIRATPDTKRH